MYSDQEFCFTNKLLYSKVPYNSISRLGLCCPHIPVPEDMFLHGDTQIMHGKNFSRQHFEIFFSYFSQKIGFNILCKLSPNETIYICQILFSGKNKKTINLPSAEFAFSVQGVNTYYLCIGTGWP